MSDSRVPRPKPMPRRPKRRVEDGLYLGEVIVLRALDGGETQAQIAVSRQYSRSGIAAMLRRLRILYGVASTPALLQDTRVRAALDKRGGGGT